jgi:hypothetical protein
VQNQHQGRPARSLRAKKHLPQDWEVPRLRCLGFAEAGGHEKRKLETRRQKVEMGKARRGQSRSLAALGTTGGGKSELETGRQKLEIGENKEGHDIPAAARNLRYRAPTGDGGRAGQWSPGWRP